MAQDLKKEIIGTASEDFTIIQTGRFVTDSMRTKTGADIALFLDNGKDGRYSGRGIGAKLYAGELTLDDIDQVFPVLRNGDLGMNMQVVKMTGENLIKTLEYSVPINSVTGWFYYFSGLHIVFNPAAEPGKRIQEITDAEGNEIDPGIVYTLAVMDGSVPEEYLIDCEDTNIVIRDLLISKIKQQKELIPSKDRRFELVR